MVEATVQVTQHPCSLRDVKVHLVDSVETAFECSRWLSTHDRIAIDTETSGLSPEQDIVRLVQLGDEETSYVIPLEGSTYGRAPKAPQFLGWGGFAADMLTKFTGVIDMHNASYDHSMIASTLGVELPRNRINDTRLMAHVLNSRKSTALKSLAKDFIDPKAAKSQDVLSMALSKQNGWTWATVPVNFKPYQFYAGFDTILTSRLRAVLEPRVLAQAPRAYQLELAVSWPCEDMERRGVLLDVPYTEEFARELVTSKEQLETWAAHEYDGLRISSNNDVINILLRDGVDLIERTDSGAAYSLDKAVLCGIDHPLAKAVLQRRQAQKIIGYLRSYLEFHRASPDGRIHPDINTVGGSRKNAYESGGGVGVKTGRMSMSNPNLQNVPTRTKEGAKVRRCFVPREGHTWVKCDADQIESRILGHLCGDVCMQEAFRTAADTGGDFFVELAKMLFQDPDFRKSDPRRQLVKNGSYAKIYGAGIPKFANTVGISERDAAEFMRQFDTMFPRVPHWISQTLNTAMQRKRTEGEAYVRSPLTGRRHTADPKQEYALINYLIQGLAGEVLKLKIVEADAAGLGDFMLFPVHDEIDFEVPTEILPEFLRTLSATVNDSSLLSVPITWSADTGPSWGECK